MFLQVTKTLLVVISLQIAPIVCDLFDDAKAQLDELRSGLQGNILIASDNLDNLFVEFSDFADDAITQGTIKIELEAQTIDSKLTVVKNLGRDQQVDITSCLRGREDYLEALPGAVIGQFNFCIKDLNATAVIVVTDGKYIVDTIINRVDSIEFQIGQCKSEACVEPLLELIILESIQLPDKIDIEVERATSLIDNIKSGAQDCQNTFVSIYIENSNIILDYITDCVNEAIGF